jgi:hypothetical protein
VSAHSRGGRGHELGRGQQPGQAQPPDGPPEYLWALLVIAAALIGGLAAAELVHASLIVAVIVAVVAGIIAVAVFRSSGRPGELPFAERNAVPGGRVYGDRPPYDQAPGDAAYGDATHGDAPYGDAPYGDAAYGDPASAGRPRTAPPPGATIPTASIAPAHPAGPPHPAGPAHPARPAGPAHPGGPAHPAGPGRGRDETAVQLLPLPQPGDGNSRQAAGAGNQSWWDAAQGAPPPPSPGAERAPAPDLSTYLASTFIAQCPRCGAFRLDIGRARNGLDFRCESCEFIWTWQPGTPWPPVRVMPGRRRESHPPTS